MKSGPTQEHTDMTHMTTLDELMSLGGVGCLLRYRSDLRNDESFYLAHV
jgi:hypothetical protein